MLSKWLLCTHRWKLELMRRKHPGTITLQISRWLCLGARGAQGLGERQLTTCRNKQITSLGLDCKQHFHIQQWVVTPLCKSNPCLCTEFALSLSVCILKSILGNQLPWIFKGKKKDVRLFLKKDSSFALFHNALVLMNNLWSSKKICDTIVSGNRAFRFYIAWHFWKMHCLVFKFKLNK